MPRRRRLDPGLLAERKVYRRRISAVHQPDSGKTREQPDESTTGLPSHQVSRNFSGVDQREANEDDHNGYVAGLQKNERRKAEE